MSKVQDTYNPVTGEYVKRISDWITIDGNLGWSIGSRAPKYLNAYFNHSVISNIIPSSTSLTSLKYNTKKLDSVTPALNGDTCYIGVAGINFSIYDVDSGFGGAFSPSVNEIKAYFHGWKMCNADGTSPYYKSEVPYTPATWAEWNAKANCAISANAVTLSSTVDTWGRLEMSNTSFVAGKKYGVLTDIATNTLTVKCTAQVAWGANFIIGAGVSGKHKGIITAGAITNNNFRYLIETGETGIITIKDVRVFELPTGSQIESDFTNLTADQLTAKYTFNGLCVKHWKKVTDGTGLTSTLPTATYAGYTPYKMIYQLATPEISYLTPKTTIPLYDTNTIVETDTPSDCKADVTVGYKLKSGVTAVAGDITAPTPDYMSAVNSVSEDGLGNGIVRSPNIVENGNFANGTNGWGKASLTTSVLNNELTAIATSDWNGRITQTIGGEGKYYIFADIKSPSGSVGININSYTTASVYHSGNGAYQRISAVLTSNISSTYMVIVDKNLVVNAKTFFVKNVGAVNLTQIFGEGNEPTKEQCDILFATWQDKASTQATLPTLRKIGTVADTYNPETGILVQRIVKKVFDGKSGDGYWSQYNTSVGSEYPCFAINGMIGRKEATSALVTHGKAHSLINTNILNGLVEGYWAHSSPDYATYLYWTVPYDIIGSSKSATASSNVNKWKAYLAQQYANGTPVTVYYQLATPVITTLATTALPTYKPTTVIESDSTVKGNVSTDYKLKANATPVAGDFIASPECVNDIKDLGNSIDVVSSVGRRNLLSNTNKDISKWTVNSQSGTKNVEQFIDEDGIACAKITMGSDVTGWRYAGYYPNIGLIKENEQYTLSFDCYPSTTRSSFISLMDGSSLNNMGSFLPSSQTLVGNQWNHYSGTITTNNIRPQYQVIYFSSPMIPVGETIIIKNMKLEKSTTNSKWTPSVDEIPYNAITNDTYKTNILLGAPLRSVGAVKDRLFKDSDGKWKVERNIGEKVFDGTEYWNVYTSNPDKSLVNFVTGGYSNVKILPTNTTTGYVICSHFVEGTGGYTTRTKENITAYLDVSANFTGAIKLEKLGEPTNAKLKSYLAQQLTNGTPVTVQYLLATPTYETLSQELQTKLDNIPTFPEHNYVYTVTNDNLQPTLHVDYKKLSWLKSRLLLNSLKIYSRNLTDAEMIQNYKVEKERFGM